MIYVSRHSRIISLFSIFFVSSLIWFSVVYPVLAPLEAASYPPERILPPAPSLSAHAFLVKFVGEDRNLIGQRKDKRLAPASLNKILTATLALEHLFPEDD